MKKLVLLFCVFLLSLTLSACESKERETLDVICSSDGMEDPQSKRQEAAGAEASSPQDIVSLPFPLEVWAAVDSWSTDSEKFWSAFLALPEESGDAKGRESQESVLEWLVWFAEKPLEEQGLICHRPEYIGVYTRDERKELIATRQERLSARVFQMVERELKVPNTPRAEEFWGRFYALPVRESTWNQEYVLYRLEKCASLVGSTLTMNDCVYCIGPDVPPTPESRERADLVDPKIAAVVEQYTYDAEAWWAYQFYGIQGENSLAADTLEERQRTMDWLEWFVVQPDEEQQKINYRPFLFRDS